MAVPVGSLAQRADASPEGGAVARLQLSVVLQRKASEADGPVRHARNLVEETAKQEESVAMLPVGIPGPRYYDARELSQRAKAIGDIDPLPLNLVSSESGRLVLVLRIANTGRVDDVDVEQTTVDNTLATALADRFRALRFHPAERDGITVASRMKIEVLLRPPGA